MKGKNVERTSSAYFSHGKSVTTRGRVPPIRPHNNMQPRLRIAVMSGEYRSSAAGKKKSKELPPTTPFWRRAAWVQFAPLPTSPRVQVKEPTAREGRCPSLLPAVLPNTALFWNTASKAPSPSATKTKAPALSSYPMSRRRVENAVWRRLEGRRRLLRFASRSHALFHPSSHRSSLFLPPSPSPH